MRENIFQLSDFDSQLYPRADFNEFTNWIRTQVRYNLDIETNLSDKWNEFKLMTIQFGSCEFSPKRKQYLFQWSYLTNKQKQTIKEILEDDSQQKLTHNGRFEYIVLRFHGITIGNLYDTMLAEKILKGGMEAQEYSLADISWKYLRIIMNKDEQTQFGDNIITDNKILYACTDVLYLDIIQRMQIQEGAKENLLNVFALEMEVLPAFCDITYEGMILDQEKWRENIKLAEPLVAEAYKQLNTFLMQEPFYTYAKGMQFVSEEDRVVINFNSVQQRTELLKLLFPDIMGGTKVIVTKYVRDNAKFMDTNDMLLLNEYMSKSYTRMEGRLIDQHRDYLIAQGYLIPAGEITINWGSRDQCLGVIQRVLPKLRSLAEEETAKFSHPILQARSEYMDSLKLLNAYGEDFIRKYVCSDGKVRTSFNQVLSTGRVSSSSPNMQQLPVKDSVGTRYRNAFIAEEEWVFVDSDYTGQELALLAYASKDPVWISAIERGEDLHSVCADLVFAKDWKIAKEDNCGFFNMIVNGDGTLVQAKQKCNCKKHKILRTAVKTVNFGLCYGMSEIKLAGTIKVSRQEAIDLINDYFKVFPAIKRTLEFLGHFGIRNGYIQTFAPFFRKRWFPYWYENRMFIDSHISGVKFNGTLGEIERASKNMPFQGGGSDMVKVALILIRSYIKEHKLQDTVKLQMQVHDQVTTKCKAEFANAWKLIMDDIMCEAAKIIIPTGLLKAETNVTPVWTK